MSNFKYRATMPRALPPKNNAEFVIALKTANGGRYELSGQHDEDAVLKMWSQATTILHAPRKNKP